jgi:F0F1-type ATP synthase assembly protein I
MSTPRGAFLTVILVQTVLTAVLAVLAATVTGGLAAGSVVVGGTILVAGNLAYAWIVRKSKVTAKSGDAVLMRHVLAEIAKLSLVVALMVVAFAGGWFSPVWLLAAVGLALAGHWIAVLFVK